MTTVSSVIPALVQTGDRVIVDQEVHLGFRTGLRLCKAEVTWVPHHDLSAVEEALKATDKKKEARRTFVMMEGICLAP